MNAAPMLSQKSSWPSNDECRSWVDGVDKVGDETGGPLKLGFCRSFARRPLWGAARSLTLLTLFATHAHATHAAWTFGGGRQTWPASVLRFCTMAARWNSSRAPERPRKRIRSKR